MSGGNVFSTVITSGNNCAWADATACFIETLEEVEESNTSWTAAGRGEMLYILQCYVC